MSPREIRKANHKSLDWTAVQAGVSYPTAAKYEADSRAVTPEKRDALDRVYAELAKSAAPRTG